MSDTETPSPPLYLIFTEVDVHDLERIVQQAILGGYVPIGNILQLNDGSFLQAVWLDLR